MTLIEIIDIVCFAIVAFATAYMLFFAVCSMWSRDEKGETQQKQKQLLRFIVVVLAHRQDRTVIQTVNSILGQSYVQRQFDVTVISDHQREMTNMRLAQLPVTLITPNLKDATRTKLLQYAMLHLPRFKQYDVVLLLNGNDLVDTDYIERLNNAYVSSGTKCMQTHVVSRRRDTPVARLEAVAGEINNSIFRRGHVAIGLSASLCNTGVAYDFDWFNQAIMKVANPDEQKEMEAMLMRDHIFIDYAENIHVFDEKTRHEHDFSQTRSTWVRQQRLAFMSNMRYLPSALLRHDYDLIDKLLQWLLIPRTTMMAIVMLMDVTLGFVFFSLVIKWWAISALVLLAFAIATPNYLVDEHWDNTFLHAPLLVYKRFLRKPVQITKNIQDGYSAMAVSGWLGGIRNILHLGSSSADEESEEQRPS